MLSFHDYREVNLNFCRRNLISELKFCSFWPLICLLWLSSNVNSTLFSIFSASCGRVICNCGYCGNEKQALSEWERHTGSKWKIGRLVSGWKIPCYHWNNGYVLDIDFVLFPAYYVSFPWTCIYLYYFEQICLCYCACISVWLHELLVKKNCFNFSKISYQSNLLFKSTFLFGGFGGG